MYLRGQSTPSLFPHSIEALSDSLTPALHYPQPTMTPAPEYISSVPQLRAHLLSIPAAISTKLDLSLHSSDSQPSSGTKSTNTCYKDIPSISAPTSQTHPRHYPSCSSTDNSTLRQQSWSIAQTPSFSRPGQLSTGSWPCVLSRTYRPCGPCSSTLRVDSCC
jgi:hypothetical protein